MGLTMELTLMILIELLELVPSRDLKMGKFAVKSWLYKVDV